MPHGAQGCQLTQPNGTPALFSLISGAITTLHPLADPSPALFSLPLLLALLATRLQGIVKPALQRLRDSYSAKARELADLLLSLQEQADSMRELLAEREEENRNAEAQVGGWWVWQVVCRLRIACGSANECGAFCTVGMIRRSLHALGVKTAGKGTNTWAWADIVSALHPVSCLHGQLPHFTLHCPLSAPLPTSNRCTSWTLSTVLPRRPWSRTLLLPTPRWVDRWMFAGVRRLPVRRALVH